MCVCAICTFPAYEFISNKNLASVADNVHCALDCLNHTNYKLSREIFEQRNRNKLNVELDEEHGCLLVGNFCVFQ